MKSKKKREEDNFTLRCKTCNAQVLIVEYPEKTKLKDMQCKCGGKTMMMQHFSSDNGFYVYKDYRGFLWALDERGNFHSLLKMKIEDGKLILRNDFASRNTLVTSDEVRLPIYDPLIIKETCCTICSRVIPDDVRHCEISDCPHLHYNQ